MSVVVIDAHDLHIVVEAERLRVSVISLSVVCGVLFIALIVMVILFRLSKKHPSPHDEDRQKVPDDDGFDRGIRECLPRSTEECLAMLGLNDASLLRSGSKNEAHSNWSMTSESSRMSIYANEIRRRRDEGG